MTGLLVVAIVLSWSAATLWLAYRLSLRVQSEPLKVVVFLVVAPAIFFAPVADHLLGKWEFDRLCTSIGHVKFTGAIPVGEEFYTPEGQWRLAHYSLATADAHTVLVRRADSLVRWETGDHFPASSILPIRKHQTQVFSKADNRLLAQWTTYSFSGGFLRRNVWPAEESCRPALLQQPGYGIYKQIFVLQR